MPTPNEGMKKEAALGLAWRKEFNRGGTMVGVARARDIKNGADLSLDTVKRMRSFFARHEVDKEAEGFRPGEKGYPSNGRIAWALWGGDAGKSWASAKLETMHGGPMIFPEDEEFLAHYGAKGMKWGVRKDRGGTKKPILSTKKNTYYLREGKAKTGLPRRYSAALNYDKNIVLPARKALPHQLNPVKKAAIIARVGTITSDSSFLTRGMLDKQIKYIEGRNSRIENKTMTFTDKFIINGRQIVHPNTIIERQPVKGWEKWNNEKWSMKVTPTDRGSQKTQKTAANAAVASGYVAARIVGQALVGA